ncbi:MAG: NlpC/P60 family protein [Acidaminococcus sp.]|jgi:hypothetical protein|nr:NlpC/P60 family protein [Acidaminococcus sp.]MCI2100399.1 NlpC/P60 family protein [Acidaminococcus sp.]MCI2114720.1 NlpC/P60 family protein [Acidaminococcus sp.]MCI2116705.1 NlpC/P60 family protein [Acidaminococcus sp.]
MRFKQFSCVALTVSVLTLLPHWGLTMAKMPDTPAAYTEALTWKEKNGDVVMASPARIAAMNAQMKKSIYGDIREEKDTIDGKTLRAYVTEAPVNMKLYVRGKPVTKDLAARLRENAVALIKDQNNVKYGVLTSRANVRVFPTEAQAFETPADTNFDDWQCSAADPTTPVRIYVADKTGSFYYVRTPDYRGWVPSRYVALTDRATWKKFVEPADPAVVTGRLLTLKAGTEDQLYQMGTAIPTEKGNLLLPVRDDKGTLKIIRQKPNYNDSLHKGYLPYTANNIVTMAFRHLGAPYGWGGLKNSVDCSAFSQDVYKTVGIQLPRNSGEQARSFPGKDVRAMTLPQKLKYIDTLPAGALLFKPGHVMIYLGEKNGTPYMIHALGSYGERTGNKVKANYVLEVVVSKVDLLGRSGKSLAEQLTKVNVYR